VGVAEFFRRSFRAEALWNRVILQGLFRRPARMAAGRPRRSFRGRFSFSARDGGCSARFSSPVRSLGDQGFDGEGRNLVISARLVFDGADFVELDDAEAGGWGRGGWG